MEDLRRVEDNPLFDSEEFLNPSREQALGKLAERLYWNMQRLDPDIASPAWLGLTDRQKRFYCLLVSDLIEFDGLIQIARGLDSTGSGNSA